MTEEEDEGGAEEQGADLFPQLSSASIFSGFTWI